jgi:hypothetical protein
MLVDKKSLKASSAARAHVDDLLDEALNETFPASDPVAINIEREWDEREVLRVRGSRAPVADRRSARWKSIV